MSSTPEPQPSVAAFVGSMFSNSCSESPSPTLCEPIMQHFDDQGRVGATTPKHWALRTCLPQPLHQSREHEDSLRSLSMRKQHINATKSMEKDQARINNCIMKALAHYERGNHARQLTDGFHRRQVELMFEPLGEMSSQLFEELSNEMEPEPEFSAGAEPMTPSQRRSKRRSRGTSNMINLAGSFKDHLRLSRARSSRLTEESDKRNNIHGIQMSNEKHVVMLNTFQRYIQRVNGGGRAELMRRSTWLRFLLHCGLLGNTVTFTSAVKPFATCAESWANPPALTFIGWTTALLTILRELWDNEEDVVEHLFEVYLKRCDERLQAEEAEAAYSRSHTPAEEISSAAMRRQMHARRKEMKPGCTQLGLLQPLKKDAALAWHIVAAEEQMCEPEVILLLHTYRLPLQALFAFYVKKQSESGDLEVPDQDADSWPLCPGVLSEHTFHGVLSDMQLFPDVVQVFALRQHLAVVGRRVAAEVSEKKEPPAVPSPTASRDSFGPRRNFFRQNSRGGSVCVVRRPSLDPSQPLGSRGGSQLRLSGASASPPKFIIDRPPPPGPGLNFPAFVECLCRIAFVYLTFYGNAVQQHAPSKWKALWLLILLRTRCRDLGPDIGLPDSLIGVSPSGVRLVDGGPLWRARTDVPHIDTIEFADLIVWPVLRHARGKLPDDELRPILVSENAISEEDEDRRVPLWDDD